MLFLVKSLIFFFTAVLYTLIEYLYSFLKGDKKHLEEETKEGLYNGLILMFTETTSVILFIIITTKIYHALWGEIPHSTLPSILATVVVLDFLYYLYHKAHHSSAKLFKIHSIHHVGTKYNLNLAVMLPWIGQASIYLMFVPLVFLRISPYAIISAYFFLLTYQFFCHIAYLHLPKWCDLFFITPRNHRVHHHQDRNDQSHNFGAILSLWDRVFGTYTDAKEDKEHVFGIAGYPQKHFYQMQKDTITQFFKK